MICQEESVKILSNLFSLNSEFWLLWNGRKVDYHKAIELEKNIKQNPTFTTYSKLAALKSSFGNCAIDTMYELSKNKPQQKEVYKILLKTHDYFSVAYQLNDDILDFIDDYKNHQFNWCIYNFDEKYFDNYSIEDCKKIFYLEGNAIKIFNQGIDELDKALNLLNSYNLESSLWFNHISDMKLKFQNSVREIESYLFQLEVDIEKSNTLIENNKINDAINLGSFYIKKSMINNQWCEYYNQGGISNIWSTSFVLSKIVSLPNFKKLFEKEIEMTSQFLLSSKSNNNMWGYSNSWIDDADSTNFALISLHSLNKLKKYNHENWFSYFNSNYFSTYNDKDYLITALSDKNIINVDGWCSSHHCVSAVSLYYLSITKINPKYQSILLNNFLSLDLDKIKAYWWSDSIYTLYYIFLSYKELGLLAEIEKIQDYIGSKVIHDFFEDNYGKNLFFTALALEILIGNKKHSTKINNLKNYLLKNQFDDGSWIESNSLCIPKPENINPENVGLLIQKFGIGVRSEEFNRLFTTISVLRSLYLWKNQN